jgi:hypothetical protein
MSRLTFLIIVAAIVVIIGIINWRIRLKEAKKFTQQQEHEVAERKKHLGPDFKTGAGTPEPEINLYEPPGAFLDEHITPGSPGEQGDAAVALRHDKLQQTLAIGATRLGGRPDLPPNIPWPSLKGKKLPFLVQLDLSTLPKSALPAEGWLYVFGLCDDEHGTPVTVFHHTGPRTELVRASRPGTGEIWADWNMETVYSPVPLQTTNANGWNDVGGQLLGDFADDEGGAAGIAEANERSGDDWITLVAISSTGSMLWSDCGWFHIAIRRQDLLKQDFSNVCASLSLEG